MNIRQPKLKDYLYFSRNRVDWLFNQIKSQTKKTTRLEKSLSIGFGILNASVKESDNPNELSIYEKIKVIEEYLESSNQIGSLESSSDYIRINCEMRYCHWYDGVFFAGQVEEVLFGMVGSIENLVHKVSNIRDSVSMQGSDLYSQMSMWQSFLENNPEKSVADLKFDIILLKRGISNLMNYSAGFAMHQMQVVAKREISQKDKDGTLILGASPVYVATY